MSIKVGIYTKRIYNEDINPSTISECCVNVFKEDLFNKDGTTNEEYLNKIWMGRHLKCAGCFGCPASRN